MSVLLSEVAPASFAPPGVARRVFAVLRDAQTDCSREAALHALCVAAKSSPGSFAGEGVRACVRAASDAALLSGTPGVSRTAAAAVCALASVDAAAALGAAAQRLCGAWWEFLLRVCLFLRPLSALSEGCDGAAARTFDAVLAILGGGCGVLRAGRDAACSGEGPARAAALTCDATRCGGGAGEVSTPTKRCATR